MRPYEYDDDPMGPIVWSGIKWYVWILAAVGVAAALIGLGG